MECFGNITRSNFNNHILIMAKDKVVLEAEVKSNIGEVTKDAEQLASEFRIMGISLEDVKQGFGTFTGVAKKSFATIRAGIMSTGIGALLVAVGSLVAWFTKTKVGAEALERIFAGVGAAVSVIIDRVAKFGSAIVKVFEGDFKGAGKDVWNTFKGIGKEIIADTTAAIVLKKALQGLRDSERELNVETAQRRTEIEKLKLIAEDVTKTEVERLEASRKAFNIEKELLDKRVKNAEEAIRIQKRQMKSSNAMAEDLDALAELEINLANIKGESFTKQIELNNKINQIEAETEAKRKEAHGLRMQQIEDEKAAREKAAQDALDQQIKMADAWYERTMKLLEKEKATTKKAEEAKLKTIQMGFDAAESIAGESEGLAKSVAVAKTIYNTQQAIMNAMANVPAPWNVAQAVATGVMGMNAIRTILSTDSNNASAGGGSISASGETPAPEMMSGAFTLNGGQQQDVARAYVVSDDITNNQDKLAMIRRRATI